MGGFGSGRHGSRQHLMLAKRLPSVDIRDLESRPGWHDGIPVPFTWRNSNGESYSVRVRLTEVGTLIEEVDLFGRGHRFHKIEVERTGCHFGGGRAWFRCPRKDCGLRAAIVYLRGDFACRKCHKLGYFSQRSPAYLCNLEKAQQIRERLGGSADMTQPFPRRPKGMHWTTYLRLLDKHDDANARSYPPSLTTFVEKLRKRRVIAAVSR